MELQKEDNKEFRQLLNGLLDEQLTCDQMSRLEQYLQTRPELMKHYVDTVTLTVGLRKYSQTQRGAMKEAMERQTPDESVLWQTLADDEKQATVIRLKKRNWFRWFRRKRVPIQIQPKETNIQWVHRRISRLPITTLIVTSAALILMLIYIRHYPYRTLATLEDSIGSVWSNRQNDFQDGRQFYPFRRPQTLEKGFARVQFTSGAEAIFEGPCRFVLENDKQFFLQKGNVFVRVPKQAAGFSVLTPSCNIVDMGTEFGVAVQENGESKLQMFSGKAFLTARQADGEIFKELILAGQARQVESKAGTVSDTLWIPEQFVRHIDSGTAVIWRGQKTFDLADIAGGGAGLGTGTTLEGINPVTGKMENIHGLDRITSNVYRTLPGNPFIDGVFVPDGKTTQIISSQGHIFKECPVTLGNFYTAITNTPQLDPLNRWSEIKNETDQLGNSFLLMHANNGITFDLNAIRSSLTGEKIGRFKSRLYMCQTAPGQPNGDFWVLVDGNLHYSKRKVSQKGFVDSVTIELHDNDRFLTLVTTDGGDPESRTLPGDIGIRSIDSDWAVFAEPVIELTASNTGN